jgi:hypothetical protein
MLLRRRATLDEKLALGEVAIEYLSEMNDGG